MRALTEHEERDLRASIERFGVLVPVVFDVAGHCVDGHNRKRIADALGVPYPTLTLSENADAQHIGIDLNLARRHLTDEERNEMIDQLNAEGYSTREVAERAGVHHKTVERKRKAATSSHGADAPRDEPARKPGRDGKRVTTAAERTERRAKVAEMHKQGMRNTDIGRALDVSEKIVRDDLRALGVPSQTQKDEAEALGRLLQQFQDTCAHASGWAHDVELLARRLPRHSHASLFVQHGRASIEEAFTHLTNAVTVFDPVPDDASSLTNPTEGSE